MSIDILSLFSRHCEERQEKKMKGKTGNHPSVGCTMLGMLACCCCCWEAVPAGDRLSMYQM